MFFSFLATLKVEFIQLVERVLRNTGRLEALDRVDLWRGSTGGTGAEKAEGRCTTDLEQCMDMAERHSLLVSSQEVPTRAQIGRI